MADPAPVAQDAQEKAKKTKTVKKATPKKAAVKKAPVKKAPVKKAAPAKSVKPKSSTASVKKAVKGKVAKPSTKAKKPAKVAAAKVVKKIAKSPKVKAAPTTASGFSKFETLALEAIVSIATEEKPYVSASKVKQYVLDYEDKALPAQVPRFTKNALTSLLAKKILKAKKDSYAFTQVGKDKAPTKVPNRKKVVRVVKDVKPKKAEPSKPSIITLSGRTSRPVALPA
jgi:hypothetical protein